MCRIVRSKIFVSVALVLLLGVTLSVSLSSLYSARAQKSEDNPAAVLAQNARLPMKACGACNPDKDADKPHLLAASYYSVSDNLSATLMLNNKGPKPLEVKPTLFNLRGERRELPAIIVEGTSFREIDLRDYGLSGTDFQEGSIQLFHRGKDLVLGAQVKLIDSEHSLVFEEKLLEVQTEIGSQKLEALWWLPSRRGEIRLILSNTGDSTVSATAAVDRSAPKQKQPFAVSLAAHETRVLDVQRDIIGQEGGALKEVGGITVEHDGAKGALLARILTQDAPAGYSASLRFFDPQKAKSSKLQGTGLRLGEVAGEKLTPVVVARNVGSSETVLTGRIPYTKKDGTMSAATLPELRLAPGETRLVEMTAAIKQKHIEKDVATAGLEFEYSSAPGSVIMSAQSVSEGGNHAFLVPMWDIAAQRSSTGGYPWNAEGNSTTIVYIKNVTDHSQKYALQLNYIGGENPYVVGVRTVEAGQTVALDVRKLRDEQVPDENGRMIPLDATSGQIHWSVRSADQLPLIGRSEQVDVTKGLSSSYACQNCCGDTFDGGWLTPGSFFGFIGNTSQFAAQEQYHTCYYQPVINNVYAAWSSLDSTKMTVDQDGLATAIDVGATSIRATWPFYSTDGDYPYCYYNQGETYSDAPTTIAPRIDSISPVAGLVGSTISVTIQGQGFTGGGGAGPIINTISGISTNITSYTDTEIQAQFIIDVNASGGDREVRVSISGNLTSNEAHFFVQIPSRLVQITVGPLQTPVDGDVRDLRGTLIARHQCGVYRNYAYYLVDQQGQRILQAFTISEEFQCQDCPFGPPTATPANIEAGSVVPDIQVLTFTYPRCLGFFENERFLVGFNVQIGSRSFDLSTIIQVRRGSFNGDLRVDADVLFP